MVHLMVPCDSPTLSFKSDQQLDCALDLMRRLPPQQIEKNLSDLIDLVPSLCEDLLSSVDQPLKIARDKVVGKDYLLCDYNRDGDSYRSPWSNKYDPPLEDGAMPSARLRKLEVEANNAFDQYRDLYFEGGVSSVYLWDLDHGFAGVILIKKAGDGSKKIKGCWDSIHVVEVQEKSSGRTAHYKLTSTVMLWLQTNKSGSGTMNLGGSLTRQMEKDETVSDCSPHIANIGRLVEVSGALGPGPLPSAGPSTPRAMCGPPPLALEPWRPAACCCLRFCSGLACSEPPDGSAQPPPYPPGYAPRTLLRKLLVLRPQPPGCQQRPELREEMSLQGHRLRGNFRGAFPSPRSLEERVVLLGFTRLFPRLVEAA
uniref:F-actin-capping protein subunit beta n=1 Tax=Suricata suricatta TaxID=37032 RepID=A0A673ULM3_SURSU